jgi:dihydrofolate reductase/thymidylate synthase
LPWLADKIGDLEYVRVMTTTVAPGKKNICIVGRKTWESLPEVVKQDPIREFWILSSSMSTAPAGPRVFRDERALYSALLTRYYVDANVSKIIVFGGSDIYTLFLQNRWMDRLYVTHIQREYPCDTAFPLELLNETMKMVATTTADSKGRMFCEYVGYHTEHPEMQYLKLLESVYFRGERRETRNATTISQFGHSISFDIAKFGFPLLTTKRMFWKGIVEELLWFLRGDTNANHLAERGVHIWDGNTTREYLDSIGLRDYPAGCGGPIYGYQWKYFNKPYDIVSEMAKCSIDSKESVKLKESQPTNADFVFNYTRSCEQVQKPTIQDYYADYFKTPKQIPMEAGVDQIADCLNQIQNNPTSRRILFSGWNPSQMSEMALPPCHILYQFYVDGNNRLSCHMYQRSADLFLGLPFNIASTALMTTIFAKITGRDVGGIRISLGDAHIYAEHTDNVLEQLMRRPMAFPAVRVASVKKLEEYNAGDIELVGYTSHDALKSKMVA